MYDLIVIGAGHAGCEASLAAARLGKSTLLVTGNADYIAAMPCNPSIGGPAKGIVVREIDALGGEMARTIDETHLQMRLLNYSKGPAVRALRAQADKVRYPERMKKSLLAQDNLDVREHYVSGLIVEDDTVKGVVTDDGVKYLGRTVVLSTGTFMRSRVLIGSEIEKRGPEGEQPSLTLSPQLAELGFKLARLKTGTPPRVHKDTIDFTKTVRHDGDDIIRRFSLYADTEYDVDAQLPCHLTHTTEETHRIIEANLDKSSMYSGVIEGVGPRYCPSIEDKFVRFRDKDRHQVFLEPESERTDDIYIQGFSTSMPKDVQEDMVRSLPGLENARITKYAYAIEYDAIDARQLWPSLESKPVRNLYFAGQVNGTSGYEEAAGQGLMAGINAARRIDGEEPLVLKRNEAYIGVLIDDLVTKGTIDPYRLLTSRAEHRLLLRNDNADLRLMEKGYELGLVPEGKYLRFKKRQTDIKELKEFLRNVTLYPKPETNTLLEQLGTSPLRDKTTFYDLVKRPEVHSRLVRHFHEGATFAEEVFEQVDIEIKYEGYIKKANEQAERLLRQESVTISPDIDYDDVKNIASEAREKLKKIRPLTLGQAARISGVNPSDLAVLHVYLRSRRKSENGG